MANQPVEFIFGLNSYKARSSLVSSERLLNCYLEYTPKDSPFKYSIYGTPGVKVWKDFNLFSPILGFEQMGDYLFAVVGQNVYRIEENKNSILIGSLSSIPGRVMMANNGTQLSILTNSGTVYYCTEIPGSLTLITDPNLDISDSITNLDGYTVLTKRGERQFQFSALNNTASYSNLNKANVESNSEDIVRVINGNLELWFFKKSVTEIFYDAGDTTYTFLRKNGAVIGKGCAAKFSVVYYDNSFFFLGNDKIIYKTNGYQLEPISTHAIAAEFESYGVVNDAFAFIYNQEGHIFYCITFPTADKTWCYDLTTQLFHERESSNHRWLANCYTYFAGKHLIGDYRTGIIYELDLNTYTENENLIKRELISSTKFAGFDKATVDEFMITMDTGVGTDGDQLGKDPQIMAQWSMDGAKNWSNESWQPVGSIGSYETEIFWTKLGFGRSLIIKLMMSDPVKFALMSSFINVNMAKNF